jgi:hypothetical protein
MVPLFVTPKQVFGHITDGRAIPHLQKTLWLSVTPYGSLSYLSFKSLVLPWKSRPNVPGWHVATGTYPPYCRIFAIFFNSNTIDNLQVYAFESADKTRRMVEAAN